MFAPQCGHNVVQCCPKVAPLLPHFCPNVALMLAHCCSNVVHCCPQCPQFGPSLASFERSHSSVGQSVRLITVRLRVQVSVDLLGSKWSLNSEIRMGHQCCPIVDPMWPQCCFKVAIMLLSCVVSTLPQCGHNVAPRWPQCCPSVAPMLPQCGPNVAPMGPQCCHQAVGVSILSGVHRIKIQN